ncbi:TRAP transporter substrate-binding protein [Desulfofustis glycolicus]|uniref:TRAP-type C4-dicarboxylate transport system, substrate-binding protein n=1 Tax=Desulfofustis glycolicus DSM 9705 TaxID=1121409 RepID=A0A1M5RYM7_9BACT|nr:TRAP transporter substrate-binding protein [Desulfofustis glycolicus]MCB2216318.1 TRAP transporter substrate-binding protein [Desulfobulbaceae bacterium]SHH31309.1 TRAP-type C4-dicarboxylate transport system, substrate-binding protein [Desulfofustis glycolicus DSM 9705]
MKRKTLAQVVMVPMCAFLLSLPVQAADKVSIRALGGFTKQIQSTLVEQPFFEELATKHSDRLDVQFRTMDELGQKGFQALRQLKAGVFDIMEMQLGYISGEDAFFQGVDLVGVAPDVETARKVADAYREEFDSRLQKKFNGKLLAIWPYGDQVFWFKEKINGLDDFQGKKIRVFSRPMAEFVKHFGATGVSMAFPEVYTSLQRGVIDGAVTGALAGNTASWYEVANYLYPMPVGFSIQVHVANLDFWNKLDQQTRDLLTAEFQAMEDKLWQIGAEATQDGINCNTGVGDCKYGKPGNMTLISVSQEDRQRMKEAVEQAVLPEWVESATKTDEKAAAIWNETAGAAAGVTISGK